MSDRDTQSDSVNYLLTLAEHVATGGEIPAKVSQWFSAGVTDFINGHGPLGHCLQIEGNLGRRPETRIALQRRDELLKQAFDMCGNTGDLTNMIKRHSIRPQTIPHDLKSILDQAESYGVSLPESERQLQRICRT